MHQRQTSQMVLSNAQHYCWASARMILGTLRDASYRRNTTETSLIGAADGTYSKSAAAARYTPEQWQRLIRVILSTTTYALKPRPVVTGAEQHASLQQDSVRDLPASVQRSRRDASDARYTRCRVSYRQRLQLKHRSTSLDVYVGRSASLATPW